MVKPAPRATYEVVIIGGGVAGLSAALMLGRARRDVAVCDDGKPRNAVVDATHGFLSRDGASPQEILSAARSDVRRYPSGRMIDGTVQAVDRAAERFSVHMADGSSLFCTFALLANGVRDALPRIEGLDRYWGRSAFVCPLCDGWEVRGRRLVVAADDAAQAVGLAQELHQWSSRLTICAPRRASLAKHDQIWMSQVECGYFDRRVRAVKGLDHHIASVVLDGGEEVPCDALFLAGSLRQACGIARALGCAIDEDGMLVVDDDNQTTVSGCFAAGDAVTSVHQLIIAAASGVRAATAMVHALVRREVDTVSIV